MSPTTTAPAQASALHLPAMSFLSPQSLWLLLLLPLAVGAYVLLLRRRKRAAVRYGNFGMLKQAVGGGSRLRRHIPPALFLAAFTLMLIGIARPTAVMSVFSHKSTVILAMDVSGSMRATDIKPSRVEAMQSAAKAFIAQQPRGVIIGIVAFAGSAFLVQPPTIDRTSLDAAIDRFELQPRTAVGAGILTSLAALFPQEDFGINPFNPGGDAFDPFGNVVNRGTALGTPQKKKAVPVEPGSDKSAVVILLTDGATNAGPDPIDAAREAANHGVRVYTVGFGTPEGEIVGFGGWRMRAQLDEDALKKIADITRAQYFRAGSAQDLQAVYRLLSKSIIVETKETEITSLFTAAAAVLALLAAGLSLLWFARIL
ncbi:MAG TPA: VWA domain-containing protein [Steroidobacteraceae bacterium]|jgi:Ca-activated chloride channel family protein